MTVYIQQLPVAGSGDVLYPDAAMDAGTACLVDLVDDWAWGGAVPADGDDLDGQSILNYAMADDGWNETPGAVSTGGIVGDGTGGAVFSASEQYLTLPVGFCPPVGATKFGFIIWVASSAYNVASSVNNTTFSIAPASGITGIIGMFPGYSGGVITSVGVNGLGFNAGTPAWVAPFQSGQMHQYSFEFDMTVGGTSYLRTYLDGAAASTFTIASGAAVSSTYTRPIVGRHPSYNGQGFKGRFTRALMEMSGTPGARPFAETVALDYSRNSARLAV